MKKIIPLIFVLTAFASLECLGAQDPWRMALLIGNSEYSNQVKLPNAVSDAVSISTAIRSVDFAVTEKLILTTKAQMTPDIDKFVESLNNNDASFVFDAGHGYNFEGANYLVPVDAELKFAHHVEASCLEVKYLKDKLKFSSAGLKVIILDAGRSEEVLPVKSRGGSPGIMRFATIKIGRFEPALEMSIFSFPSPDDGVLKNVNLWRGKMGLEEIEAADLSNYIKKLDETDDSRGLIDTTGNSTKK